MDSSSYQTTQQEGNLELQSQLVQQKESEQSKSHDPSQIQASDSSHPDYNGYLSQYGHRSYYHPQDYAYYNPQPSQPRFQGETTSIHPPGVPIHPESNLSASSEQAQLQNWKNTYHSHANVENRGKLDQSSVHPRGLNPSASAAVIAFTQLSQLAESMDAAQRAGQPQIRPSPYRGGGRRGSSPFKGGGRAHFGRHGARPDNGSTPPFRGRARGRGGSSRHLSGRNASSSSSNAAFSPAESGTILVPPSSESAPVQVPEAPHWPPPRLSWCELCRVDCNSPEILEQHKNGKRHKKTLKTREELQRLNKVISGVQSDVIQSGISQGFEENLTSEVVADDSRNGKEQQRENSMESEARPADQGCGLKRKKKGGQGGKRIKTNEGSKRTVEPFFCDLCNVKCESQVVFDTHLSGKKHSANLRRFHGHKALYGEERLKELYPPNFEAASTSAAPQVQQTVGVNDPQALLAQLLMTVISQVQAPASSQPLTGSNPAAMEALAAAISSLVSLTGPPPTKSGPISEPQNGQSSEIQQLQSNPMAGEIKNDVESTKTGSGEADTERRGGEDESRDDQINLTKFCQKKRKKEGN